MREPVLGLFLGAVLAFGAQHPRSLDSATAAGARSALNKDTLEKYLRALELWPPQVNVKIGEPKPFIRGLYKVDVHLSSGPASSDVTYYVSMDGKTVIRGSAYNIDHSPFRTELERLKLEQQPYFGPANAPLTLAILSDFECPVCREEAREIRAKAPVEFPNDLRVVFIDFPLESIHPWAKAAAVAGRCVYRQKPSAFWEYHDWMFDHQPENNAENLRSRILDWAKSKGLDADQLAGCMDTRATESEVDAEIAMGKSLKVDSTPTSFLNGRPLVGALPWPNLSQILKLELEYRNLIPK